MTLRTPRRRFSPRAKRRYRVIRDFFRRAIGSSSQQDIKINSSIAINVTDLKHKIVGIEHQLNEVSKHCQDLACIENSIRKRAENLLMPECTSQHEIECFPHDSSVEPADKRCVSSATKVYYKPLDTLRRKSDESDYISNANYRNIEERKHMTLPANMAHELRYPHLKKLRQRKNKVGDRLRVGYECEQNFQKHRTKSALETYDAAASYSTSSYRSLAPPPLTECPPPAARTPRTARSPSRHHHKHTKQHEHTDGLIYENVPNKNKRKDRKRNKSVSPQRYQGETEFRDDRVDKSRKLTRDTSELDQDFITELVQKQYKPKMMFGKKNSQISQFSVPVCRDQEFCIRDSIQEGTDLCSCIYEREGCRPWPHHSLHRRYHHDDCRSVCDARLYSSKRARQLRRYRHLDAYNDSTLYDVVPVKEKPSPKSRRKFVEDDIIGYEYYKEVPPSPRTHRPQLNLKAQLHADYEEYIGTKHANRRYLPKKHKPRYYEYLDRQDRIENDEISPEFFHHRDKKRHKLISAQTSVPIGQNNDITNNLEGHSFEHERETVVDSNFNKSQDTDASDKTDKALCEIKDILQSFLQEIKKEATPTSGTGGTSKDGCNSAVKPIVNGAHTLPIVPSYTVAQCSLPSTFPVPPFTNPCCCPMLPMCSMNCMQNSYSSQSPSCTYHGIPRGDNEVKCQECLQKKQPAQRTDNKETEQLIKEIYKLVTLDPQSGRKKSRDPDRKHRKEDIGKKLTSRSVGDSSRISHRDAKVATSAMKCYSKSCEAIGSRMITETSYTTTQSDTLLEKLSLDVSRSDSELTTEVNLRRKQKTSKFATVLRSMGILKKKKKYMDDIDIDVMPKQKRRPFHQEIYDYSVHGQEYYQQPPSPPYAPGRYDSYGYVPPPPGCEHQGPYYAPEPSAPPGTYTPHRVHEQTIPEHEPHYHHRRAHPSAAPYYDPYDQHYPQVPLCLKEIEVKSTGTQSERKLSFLRKLGRKTPPGMSVRSESQPRQPRFTEGTQTVERPISEASKPLFQGWKKFQDKVRADIEQDPMMYGFKTKQQLMAGENNMKSAMIKKLFYKRNPFSPNNLIIRTLLGNDPSSYGEPKVNLKPRIFF